MDDLQKFKNVTRHHLSTTSSFFEDESDSPFPYDVSYCVTQGDDNIKVGDKENPVTKPLSYTLQSKKSNLDCAKDENTQLIQLIDEIDKKQRIERNKRLALAKKRQGLQYNIPNRRVTEIVPAKQHQHQHQHQDATAKSCETKRIHAPEVISNIKRNKLLAHIKRLERNGEMNISSTTCPKPCNNDDPWAIIGENRFYELDAKLRISKNKLLALQKLRDQALRQVACVSNHKSER